MNLEDFFGGRGPVDQFKKLGDSIVIVSSETFVAPKAGKYLVLLSGGGGSGGAGVDVSGSEGRASGGASGNLSKDEITLALNENVVVTIGAGGAGVTGSTAFDVGVSGNAGGSSTFGAYLSATGGGGGLGGFNNASLAGGVGWIDGGTANVQPESYIHKVGLHGLSPLAQGSSITGGMSTLYSGGGGASLLSSGTDALFAATGSTLDAVLGAGSGGAVDSLYSDSTAVSTGSGGSGFAIVIYLGV